MFHDPSDFGSLMLIRIIPKERTVSNDYNIDWPETAIFLKGIISNIKFTEDYILFFEISNNNIVVSQPLGQGSKGGAVVRALASLQCGPGSNPAVDAICGLSLLLVLSLAPRVFLRVLRFSPLLKNKHFQITNCLWDISSVMLWRFHINPSKFGLVHKIRNQVRFRRICMESSEHNWANISEAICPKLLIFGE